MRVCAHYGCHCWDSVRWKWCVVTLKIHMQTCPLSIRSSKCIMFDGLMNNLFYFTAIANGIFIVSPLVSINNLLKYSLECWKLCRCQHTCTHLMNPTPDTKPKWEIKLNSELITRYHIDVSILLLLFLSPQLLNISFSKCNKCNLFFVKLNHSSAKGM